MADLLPFDLETFSAKDLHRRPDFVRLSGYKLHRDVILTESPEDLVLYLEETNLIGVGHNILAFDLVALARHHGLDLQRLLGRVVDTDLLARLFDPPPSGKDGVVMRPKGYYGLDETSGRFRLKGKTDNLKEIAKEFKGYGNIPVDDKRFRNYLRGDVSAHKDLFTAMRAREEPWPGFWKYAQREMRVGLITSQMTVNGLRVDVPEIQRTLEEQAQRKGDHIHELAQLTGMPTQTRMGPHTEEKAEKYLIKAPLSTDAGRDKVTEYLLSHGISEKDIPRTPKTGKPAIGGEGIKFLIAKTKSPEVRHVLELVSDVVSERTIYQTADDFRVGDRVFPKIHPTQASGRWSVTGPGLTVFGKRGGRHVERRIILPDEGHSLLSIDLDQVDARAVAAHSQDPEYMAIFQRGEDLWTTLAIELFDDVSMREAVKPIGHGWNYGRSVKAIASDDGISLEVAERFDTEGRRKYPRIIQWQEYVRSIAAAGGLLDNGFGRKMRADPRFAYTQAPALVGQGAARDILAEGMLRMPLEFWPYLRVIVHDEIVVSAPSEDAEEIGKEIVKAMSFEFKGVPITAGCSKPAANWALCYEK